MTRFIVLRTFRGILTIWLVVTILFFVLRLSGDPADIMLGPDATPAARDAFRARNGLDEPLAFQYITYLTNTIRGDFGASLSSGRPALEMFASRVGATLELGGTAVVLALLFGIPAGIVAALKRGSLIDRLAMSAAFIGQSAPGFFIGIILILILSLQLNLLPSSGRGDWNQLIMPSFTLATGLMAALARMSRSSLLEVVNADYIRTARAKGLRGRAIVATHMLRNASLPVITLFGLWISVMIGGAAITETVFAWPGVGRLAVSAISERDYPVIQLIIMVVAGCVIVGNLLIDVLYGFLDPRISTQERAHA